MTGTTTRLDEIECRHHHTRAMTDEGTKSFFLSLGKLQTFQRRECAIAANVRAKHAQLGGKKSWVSFSCNDMISLQQRRIIDILSLDISGKTRLNYVTKVCNFREWSYRSLWVDDQSRDLLRFRFCVFFTFRSIYLSHAAHMCMHAFLTFLYGSSPLIADNFTVCPKLIILMWRCWAYNNTKWLIAFLCNLFSWRRRPMRRWVHSEWPRHISQVKTRSRATNAAVISVNVKNLRITPSSLDPHLIYLFTTDGLFSSADEKFLRESEVQSCSSFFTNNIFFIANFLCASLCAVSAFLLLRNHSICMCAVCVFAVWGGIRYEWAIAPVCSNSRNWASGSE